MTFLDHLGSSWPSAEAQRVRQSSKVHMAGSRNRWYLATRQRTDTQKRGHTAMAGFLIRVVSQKSFNRVSSNNLQQHALDGNLHTTLDTATCVVIHDHVPLAAAMDITSDTITTATIDANRSDRNPEASLLQPRCLSCSFLPRGTRGGSLRTPECSFWAAASCPNIEHTRGGRCDR